MDMIIKKIPYTDFNDVEREEEFAFNLSKAEIMEMELGTEGGYTSYLRKISQTQNVPALAKIFKELILKTVGYVSDDGKRFVKSDEYAKEFEQTEAYSNLYMELATDPVKASEFINGIIPKKLQKEIEEAKKSGKLPEDLNNLK
jgi:hypothetical protein